MTKQKAIEVIKAECYIGNLLDLDRTATVNMALDMAIQALEQSPCDHVSLVKQICDYQIKWLTSHNDIEFQPEEEELIKQFLIDTTECFIDTELVR